MAAVASPATCARAQATLSRRPTAVTALRLQRARGGVTRATSAHGGAAQEAMSGEWPSNWSIASYEDLAEFYKGKLKEEVAAKAGTPVEDVMSTRLFTTTPSTPLDKLDFGPVSGMPVMQGSSMVGIISKQDLGKPGKVVEDVMTKRVVVTTRKATVEQAAIMMLKYKVHRLPVVDEGAKVVGMITRTDVFSAMEHDLGM